MLPVMTQHVPINIHQPFPKSPLGMKNAPTAIPIRTRNLIPQKLKVRSQKNLLTKKKCFQTEHYCNPVVNGMAKSPLDLDTSRSLQAYLVIETGYQIGSVIW